MKICLSLMSHHTDATILVLFLQIIEFIARIKQLVETHMAYMHTPVFHDRMAVMEVRITRKKQIRFTTGRRGKVGSMIKMDCPEGPKDVEGLL